MVAAVRQSLAAGWDEAAQERAALAHTEARAYAVASGVAPLGELDIAFELSAWAHDHTVAAILETTPATMAAHRRAHQVAALVWLEITIPGALGLVEAHRRLSRLIPLEGHHP